MTGDAGRSFDLEYPLRGQPSAHQPRRHGALRSELEFPGQGGLPADGLARSQDRPLAHGSGFNAQTVYVVKPRSVNRQAQTRGMGKKAETPPSLFWQRLTRAWDRQGLPTSQNGIAKRMNMSQGSTRRWYTGDGRPEIEQVIELARLGRCSIHWLLTGEGLESVNLDPETASLLKHWNALMPEARTALLRTAKLEHAVQFTGDPEARSAYQKRIAAPASMVQDKPKLG